MKLASLKHGRDGRLVVVSKDLKTCVAVPEKQQSRITTLIRAGLSSSAERMCRYSMPVTSG